MFEPVKRDRSANWEHNEKLLLQALVKPYINIIDSKEQGTDANTAKKNAWSEITNKFNSINKIRYRQCKQLKTQYGVMKMNAKKDKIKAQGTTKGPGSSTSSLEISESQESFEISTKEQQCFKVESIEYEYDVDSVEALNPLIVTETFDEEYMPMVPKTSKEKPKFHVAVEVQKDVDVKEVSTQTICETSNINNEKGKNGNSFHFPDNFYEDIRKYRVKENDRQEKEHLLRVKTMQEQHNQLMKNLQLQEEILKKQLNKLE